MPAAWERGDGEPGKAYAAFCLYRDLGPGVRSLQRITAALRAARLKGGQTRVQGGELQAGAVRRVSTQVEDWSSKWRWVARARAWDAEADRKKREAMFAEIEAMGRRQATQAQAAAQVLSMPMIALGNKLKNEQGAGKQLENLTMLQLIELSTKGAMFLRTMHLAEREARGVTADGVGPLRGREAEEGSVAVAAVTVTAAEFTWVQGRCTCGHTHSAHDQEHENPLIVPCTVPGCTCKRYRDADEAEANAGSTDDD